MMNYQKLATQLYERFGDDNILHVTHCATRLRVTVKDLTRVKEAAIKELPEVIGIVYQGESVQVILGPIVEKVYDEFEKLTTDAGEVNKTKQGFSISSIIGFIADVFLPIMPIVVISGLIGAILSILSLCFQINTETGTYQVLSAMSNAGFYFFPILIGYSTAKRSGVNVVLGMYLGGLLLHSGINDVAGLDFFGLPIIQTSYASSTIPIIMGVLLMSFIQPFIKKLVPTVLKDILEPLLIVMIVTPITLIVLGPAGVLLGNWIADGLVWINNTLGWVSLTIVGALFGFTVIIGINKALVPIIVTSLATFGYDSFLMPAMLATNAAIGGAALGVCFLQKKGAQKAVSLSAGVTGLMGITEPALYGVLLPHRPALIASIIGGAIGGTISGLTHVVQYGLVTGIPAITTLIPPTGDARGMENLYFGILVMVVSAVVGLVATIVLTKLRKGEQA